MKRATVLAGFGGQGVLFGAEVLARAAVAQGLETLWFPSYGPEMRGGTANCTVIVSDTRIGSPVPDGYDAVVVLTPPSLARFEPLVCPGGTLVVNRSLIERQAVRHDVRVVDLACTKVAIDCGDERLTAVVALGALARDAADCGVPAAALRAALREMVEDKHPELLEADEAAFDAGLGVSAAAAGRMDAEAPEAAPATGQVTGSAARSGGG